jgi:aspartyl-tRNA(Asn)/glutamyl-tRNA(Gln) amidotransferase subunit C
MSDQISPETFAHLVELAALDLDASQAEYLRGELNKQLKAISELEAIPLSEDIPVTSHGVPYTPQISPPPRPDDWKPYEDPQAIIDEAPQVEDGYIIVPDIPHTTLE